MMAVSSITLASALAVLTMQPVELTLDFTNATQYAPYRIEIKLYARNGKQKFETQKITLGKAADIDSLRLFFNTAMEDLNLKPQEFPGTKMVAIRGTFGSFKRIDYITYTKVGGKWVRNDKLKGPTLVGKPTPWSPSFVVNPKPL